MNPQIKNISELDSQYKFTLVDVDVSLVNALRRTILSDIPITTIFTENYKDNDCRIDINTTRLHNELIKHRLSNIPIHIKDNTLLPGKYILELHEKNETSDTVYVTTEHFKIKNKENNQYLKEEKVHEIFPANNITSQYIDFVRLRPKMGNIPGEEIKLTADFSVHTAKEDGGFNVVCKCSYGNTVDIEEGTKKWEEREKALRSEELSEKDIQFQKKNFYLLDINKYNVKNSFDFVIQSIGIYENVELIKKGCEILALNVTELVKDVNSNIVPIIPSVTTMDNCFDVKIRKGDYTLGKMLEYFMYSKLYGEVLSYIGFKKMHPHDDECVLRVAYKKQADKEIVKTHLGQACGDIVMVIKQLNKLF